MAGDIDGPTVRLGADASAVDTELSKVSGKFEQFAKQADQSFSNIGKNFSLSNVSQQLDALSSKMRNIGSTLTLAALPFEAIGGMAVKAYSDFEQNIGKINTLLPDATKAQMQGISSELKEFSAQYGADINASTQAYYDALSAGIEQVNVMPFMEAAQKAGVAGMSDVSVAVDGLTSVMNAYQMETERATEVSDVMFKTVELGKIEFDQLANTIGKVTPTASSFGVSFQDVGAAISQITSLGVSPEETMTGLKNLIKDLGTEGSDLNKKFRELSGQGFSEFIASGGSLVDVVGMLRDYSEKTGTSFFNMTGSFEAANTLAMLGGDAFENYAGFLGKIEESAGATGKAYEAMAGTMAHASDMLKTQMQTMMIDIGEALAPTVEEFTRWLAENSDEIKDFAVNVANSAVPAIEGLFDILKKVMDAFNSMPEGTRNMLATILGVGIGGAVLGGPALYGIGTLISPLSTVVSLIGKLAVPTTVAGEIGAIGPAAAGAAGEVGLLSGALATLGGPIGAGAVVAVAAGLAAYTTNFGDFRDNINAIISDLGSAASNIASGDFEAAGRDCAEAFSKGLEAAWDVSVATIGSLPEIDRAISEMKSGFDKAAFEMSKGFADQLTSTISGLTVGLPHLLFTEEGKKELTDSIKSAVASIDLSSEGTAAMRSFASGFAGLDMILNPFVQGAVASMQGSFNDFIKGLPDLPGLEQYKKYIADTEAEAEEIKRKYGLTKPATETAFGITPTNSTIKPDGLVLTLPGSSGGASGKSAAQMLAEERNLRLEDAQKMLDSSDATRQKYEEQASAQDTSAQAITAGTEAVKGFTQAVNEAATTKTKTAAEAAVDATTAQLAAESKGGGDSYDLFSGDPAAYLENELKKDLDTFYEGSLNNLIQDYQNHGKTLQDKLHAIYQEGKYDSGYGGNESDWMAKASQALNSFNTSLSALSSSQYASDSRVVSLTQAYNQAQDATASLDRYLADSSVSASEAADMQSQLSGINSLLAQSGVDATGGLTNLPGALQAVASAVQSSMAAINAAIGAAQQAVQRTQAAQPVSENPSRAPQVMKEGPVITQNINLQNSRFSRDYDPQKVIKDAFGAIGARG